MSITKKELKDLEIKNQRLLSKVRQLEDLQSRKFALGSVQTDKERVQTSGIKDTMDIVDAVIDMERDIQRDILDLMISLHKVRQEINKIHGVYGLILEMKYLEKATWNEMADRLGYSIPHIYKLHGQALNLIAGDSK